MKRAGDVWGGFAAMLVVLPSSIAYGIAVYALLGPEYVGHGVRAGIIGAIVLGLVATALGGAPRLVSAPCAPAGAVLASLAGGLLAGGPDATEPGRIVALLVLVAVLSGALQLVYGLAGGGKLIKYIPYPVVSGYMSAVGVLIFLSQLPNFLGLPGGVQLGAGIVEPDLWRSPALIVGAVTIACVAVAPRLTRAVPATIIGLAGGLLAYFGLALARPELLQLVGNKLIIGTVGGGGVLAGMGDQWASIAGLRFADVGALMVPALTLSVLLSVDTLKTCVVVDTLTRGRHNSNKTLLGQGVGNLLSALMGGMPGAGTMGATLVSIESGGRTKLAGLLEGAFVLAAALVLGSMIAWVPVAALAGILIVVAVRMCDWGSLHLLRQKSTVLDFVVIATVVVVAVATDLIAAAAVGVALSMLLFIREQIRGSVIRRKVRGDAVSSKQHRIPTEQAVLERLGAQITACELQGSLFFGTTDQLYTELEPELKECRYLILDLRRIQALDYTAAHLFEQFEAILAEHNGMLLFSRLPPRQELREYFAQVGVLEGKKNVRKFDTFDGALQWAEDRILAAALPAPAGAEQLLALAEFDVISDVADDESLAALASSVVEQSFTAGQFIFRSGDGGDELFLIRNGIIRIVLSLNGGNYHTLASFGRGNFFGEMAFLDQGTRSADALATTATDLYVISRTRFEEVARTHPRVGVRFYAGLAQALAVRLRRSDSDLRALYEV